ncbi:flagellar export chaperone FliS [Pseudodesulfovibrio thermohalotolerans]|uniref:flagellar export chaperone FliS n=1 Tax=Pseudodesulfovibrio thermohalotolerans TaxID=2880651 RepID=UPI0024411A94|nr:flagellar export chaperone FliS [Pseudodesulfovibrio thermohalotolerans]WFS63735.1 flagellar export chaperone FliS [Pseudodesulfovibrio thermohalotolerans]
MANPAKAYLATQVETTTQGELLLMLYEAAIKFLKRAKREIDNKDYAKKGIYISKAMAIIHELSESLNKEKGGDITPKLGQLYMFCTTQLVKANIRLDNKMIDDVIKILDGLRSAYAQVVPIHDGKAAPGDTVSTGTTPKPTQPPLAKPVMPVQAAAPIPQRTETPKQSTPAPKPTPAPSAPSAPSQLRTAAAAAKFRAANAYNNANR